MRMRQAVASDRETSAIVGVALTLFALAILLYGTVALPVPEREHLVPGLVLIVFGVLLATSAVLIFVLPAAYDYWEEGTAITP